jgi:hypothetical protein
MPNWTTNQLLLTGDKDRIKELLDFIKGDDEVIDFNNIIPMPDILKNTTSGACTIDGQEVTSWYEDTSIANWEERSKSQRLFTAEETAELKRTGYTNWYDWCCDCWGTKWNACRTGIECDYGDYVDIRFDTAWSPPEPILEALREKFPDLEIQLNYRLEDDPEFPHSL